MAVGRVLTDGACSTEGIELFTGIGGRRGLDQSPGVRIERDLVDLPNLAVVVAWHLVGGEREGGEGHPDKCGTSRYPPPRRQLTKRDSPCGIEIDDRISLLPSLRNFAF